MGEGDGKSRRRGGRAVSVFGVSETHSTFVAARTSRLSDHFRPPRPAVPGVRGFLSADFMLSELSLCRMGRPWCAWGRAARFARLPVFAPPHVPRNSRPEKMESETVRSRTFQSVSPVRGWRDRQTSALKTLILRYVPTRALTSVSGCTPPRTSDASPAVPPATPVGEDLIHPRRWIHSRLPPV